MKLINLSYDAWENIIPHLDEMSFLSLCLSHHRFNDFFHDEYLSTLYQKRFTVQIGDSVTEYHCQTIDDVYQKINQDYEFWYDNRKELFKYLFHMWYDADCWANEATLQWLNDMPISHNIDFDNLDQVRGLKFKVQRAIQKFIPISHCKLQHFRELVELMGGIDFEEMLVFKTGMTIYEYGDSVDYEIKIVVISGKGQSELWQAYIHTNF